MRDKTICSEAADSHQGARVKRGKDFQKSNPSSGEDGKIMKLLSRRDVKSPD